MTPGQPPQPGPPQPPPNPALQKAQAQLQQIQQQLEQIAENKKVLELLRDEKTRGYRVEIETDSTIEPDEQAEKKSRIEFTEISGKFLGEALPILQLMPQAAPMFEQVFMFLVRGFRAGRELEDTIEQTMAAIGQAAQQPKPSPEEMKLQLEEKKVAAEQRTKDEDMKMRQTEGQQKMDQSERQHQQKMAQSEQQFQQKMAHDKEQAAVAREQSDRDYSQRDREMTMNNELATTKQADDVDIKREQIAASKEPKVGLQVDGNQALAGLPQIVGDTMAQAMQGIAEALAQSNENISEAVRAIAEGQQALAKAMSAPRSLVRGSDGRAIGSRSEIA